MKANLAKLSLVLAALALPGCGPSEPGEDPFTALVDASDYIVTGEVLRLDASTLDVIEDTSRTVVVRVDRALYAPEGFGDFTGREITILLAEGHEVEVGDQETFYCRGWLFGNSIAVVETGVAPGGLDESLVPAQIADAKASAALRRRLAGAELVVEGRIARVDGREESAPIRTEHDPRWTRVFLDVRSTLKGEPRDGELAFFYSASRDVHWYRAPKLALEQEGVFLLHRRTDGNDAELAVLEVGDVQPVERMSEIRTLLGSR